LKDLQTIHSEDSAGH